MKDFVIDNEQTSVVKSFRPSASLLSFLCVECFLYHCSARAPVVVVLLFALFKTSMQKTSLHLEGNGNRSCLLSHVKICQIQSRIL